MAPNLSRFENRSYGARLVGARFENRSYSRGGPGRAIGGDTQSRFENRSYGWIGILIGVKASSRLENPA